MALRILMILSFCAVFCGRVCFSQEESEEDSVGYELEQVTTIGTRSTERIIDIPYSVFSVDKKELSFGRKVSAKDVLADVPGMFLQSQFGSHDLRITLRGFGTRSNSGSRAVRILVDGIPESDPDGESALDAIDFASLGGVEVAKGNLSSLYANAPGGVINFLLDKYFLKSHAGSMTQVGSHGLLHQGVKVGLQNQHNRIFFTYNNSKVDGYRRHNQEYLGLVNFAYEAYLDDQSSIGLYGNHVDGFTRLPGPLTKAEFESDPFQASPIGLSQDLRRITQKGRLGIRYNKKFGEAQNTELELTLYGAFKELERADPELYAFSKRRTIGAWARVTHRSDILESANVLTVGVDYAHQAGSVTDFNNVAGVRDFTIQNEYTDGLHNLGVYFIDRYTLVEEKLDLVLSSRFDYNAFSRDVFLQFGFTDTTRTFNKFAPKLGMNYKLTRSVALYSSYGLSYDIPALSEMGNPVLGASNIKSSLNPDLNPQRSSNIELGIKGNIINPGAEFMEKMVFDITFFHYTIHDEIIPYVIVPRIFYRNAARTTRTGIEFGFKSHPLEHLEMALNYTYTHFRYRDYTANVFTPGGTLLQNYSGNTVPSIPKGLLNFILFYELPVTEEFEALFLWDCDYISGMFVDDSNTEKAPAYFYGNVLIGASVSFGDLGVVLYGGSHNIFDRRYAGYINVNDYYGRYYETGEPRSFYGGLKLSYIP